MQPGHDTSPSSVAGLLLAHGAGGGADQHTLIALQDGLDVPVRRIEFGYRREGRRFPDRAPKLIAQVRAEAEAFAAELGTTTARLVLGGRSMGGRMCSMAVAEGLPAAALVLLSYPLHPPGKPDRLRVEHLGGIGVPTLFVGGDRGPLRHARGVRGPYRRHRRRSDRPLARNARATTPSRQRTPRSSRP